MYVLDKSQVDYILNDIRRNGIETEELQYNLLDHICCVVENEMSPNMSFEEVYRNILPRFFKNHLREIQEETNLLLIFKNYYAMKKVMLRSGMFSTITFIAGSFLKIMHWPGAMMLIFLAILSMCLLFLPIFFLIKSKEVKEKKEKVIIGFGVVFGILFCSSTLFKIMHWPGANLLWLACLGVLFFLFLPVFFFSGIRNSETKLNTILSSIMILVAGGLLFTLTVLQGTKSKEEAIRIADLQVENVSISTQIANQEKYNVSTSDSIRFKNNQLKSEVENIIRKIDSTKLGLYSYLSDGQKTSEKLLLKEYYGNIDRPSMYFFKDGNMNPEQDRAKATLVNLKNDLEKFKKFVNENYSKSASAILNLDDDYREYKSGVKKVKWELLYFGGVPFEVVVRNFDQLELSIRIIESTCIQ
jgi:hypothetical protein